MPRFIIKITDKSTRKDYYLDYSTVVDAPVTHGMDLIKFKEYYLEEYGELEYQRIDERLARVDKNGCSGHYPFNNLKDLLVQSKKKILKEYCLNQV
jgi:hypothetical protein